VLFRLEPIRGESKSLSPTTNLRLGGTSWPVPSSTCSGFDIFEVDGWGRDDVDRQARQRKNLGGDETESNYQVFDVFQSERLPDG
jgi:hypothetical protein